MPRANDRDNPVVPHPRPGGRPSASLLRGASHWDRLTDELRDLVLSFVAPTLMWFLSRGSLVRAEINSLHRETCGRLWVEVLECDWQGDLRLLPPIERTSPCLLCVASRAMLERIRASGIDVPAETAQRIAVRRGWTEMLNAKHPESLAEAAALEGAVHVLKDLVDVRQVAAVTPWHVECAAEAGQLGALKWMRGRTEWPPWIADAAARSGNLDLVAWLHNASIGVWTSRTMDFAVKTGHARIVKWLAANRREGCSTAAFKHAFSAGRIDLLTFLCARYPAVYAETGDDAFGFAAHLSSLEWARNYRPHMTPETDLPTLLGAHGVAALVWLLENTDMHLTPDVLRQAIVCNAAGAVEWLVAKKGMSIAANALQVESLERSTDALAVLIRHDRRWVAILAAKVAASRSTTLAEWLHVRFPDSISQGPLDAAARCDNAVMVEFLLGLDGVVWDVERALDVAKQARARDVVGLLSARISKGRRRRGKN
ncbi:hypothetical protein HK105_201250 [Polyrhizophydium stewartii]|uniref:Ankyrin repeat protein n=1 Tax=Polyrhizophydium stewartii TaxID=2732419 RepID=A0ABR4NHH5_9FUNG